MAAGTLWRTGAAAIAEAIVGSRDPQSSSTHGLTRSPPYMGPNGFDR